MKKIDRIEGIGRAYRAKLNAAGIVSVEQMLAACRTRKDRRALAEACGVPEETILKWANQADLFRISGVGGQYAELLEAAGVDTVRELAQRIPENLTERMERVNAEKHLVRSAPCLAMVRGWVAQARQLPRILEY